VSAAARADAAAAAREAAAPARDAAALRSSFEAFTRISRALEQAYERLRAQAARVDLALAETNAKLADKVAELDASRSHLQAVLASLKAAVVVTDLEGRVTLANRAFEELCGRGAAQLAGLPKSSLVDDRGRPVCEPCGEGDGRQRLALPNRALLVRGERRVVRSSCSPVTGRDGRPLGEVETIVDETEVELLRDELKRRETLTALGEMAAGIAHELRNPLTAIEGFAHLLAQALPPDSRECAEHARRIRQGVRKADAIIQNLLCFARPERFRPRRARLAALLLELRAAFAEAAGARVHVSAPEPPDLTVACDLALLERVLVNLIENARQAAGPAGHVVVRARREDGEIVLAVEDDGPGIAPELKPRLFRPFVTGRAEGTGLGLFLVHRIVELHRGRVEASDRPCGGATFTVRLPDSHTDGVEQGRSA
jgi:two-component system sensor histidine kinase AtoS